jgi:hypothetical protein
MILKMCLEIKCKMLRIEVEVDLLRRLLVQIEDKDRNKYVAIIIREIVRKNRLYRKERKN